MGAISRYNVGGGQKTNDAENLPFRNKIINGDFSIWQRGDGPWYGVNPPSFTADRWFLDFSSDPPYLQAEKYSSNSITTDGIPKDFIRIKVLMGAFSSDFCNIKQKIEDALILANRTVTVSFWAKCDISSANIGVDLFQSIGTGGSGGGDTSVQGKKISVGNTLKRYSITFNIPSLAGKTIGTDSYTELRIWFAAGSDYNSNTDSIGFPATNPQGYTTFELSGVQLEYGVFPTQFEYRGKNTEMNLCTRYFYRIEPAADGAESPARATVAVSGLVTTPNTIARNCSVILPSIMRKTIYTSDVSFINCYYVVGHYSEVGVTSATVINHENNILTMEFGLYSSAAQISSGMVNTSSYFDVNAEL